MILIDAYNVIFKWKILKKCNNDMELARYKFIDIISNYQGFIGEKIVIVFDNSSCNDERQVFPDNVEVIFTTKTQSADMYIERLVYTDSQPSSIKVITSDSLERMIVSERGASIMSPENFKKEIDSIVDGE